MNQLINLLKNNIKDNQVILMWVELKLLKKIVRKFSEKEKNQVNKEDYLILMKKF